MCVMLAYIAYFSLKEFGLNNCINYNRYMVSEVGSYH